MSLHLTRRGALLGLGSAISLGGTSLALAQAPTDRRFVVVLLRGALDGMAAVAPYGDAGFAALRPGVAQPGAPDGLLDLGGFYGLHPALTGLHGLYVAGQMLPVHAVAGPYRSRSHFEAQDYLESGADQRLTSGWLNRVALALHATGTGTALAVGSGVPLLLRGAAPAATWLPHGATGPQADLYRSIAALNAPDRVLGPAVAEGLRDRGFSDAVLAGTQQPRNRFTFPALAGAAGQMLAAPNGPRLAALEVGGWDTHTNQAGRLQAPLQALDAAMLALQAGLGSVWSRTAVVVVTEFGRTARLNGTGGTDHGTGTVAFLLGGAAAGGQVRADWPGLAGGRLLEDRDLQPTTDLRAVLKGVLAQHLGLSQAALATVFPDSRVATAMTGLVRA